ncbi:MAG: inner membrane protein YiaA [Bacteroidota bacterium]
MVQKTSKAFVGASWAATAIGKIGFIAGLLRSGLSFNEKGFFFTVLLFGMFSVISLQKAVRDRLEKIPVSNIYYGICWVVTIISGILLTAGLIQIELLPSEKGFYAFAFVLSLFGAVAIQKNTRDELAAKDQIYARIE